MINNVIFDMDGVLVDSEPFWAQAQITALVQYGITITVADCEKYTRGVRVDELAQIWVDRFHLTVPAQTLKRQIVEDVCDKISTQGQAMTGAYELLDFLRSRRVNIALATSSDRQVIRAVFDRLKLWDYIPVQCTAAEEELAKPHPAVYLTAVRRLNAAPADCLIIEDSVIGLIAAKAANVPTFIVNPAYSDPRFAIADQRMATLFDVLTLLEQDYR